MGNCLSAIKRKKEPSKSITLAIIGIDNAGKTTMCSVFCGEMPDPDIAPTVGFRNVKFSHSNFDITLYDLGGGKNIRPIWKNYFGEVFGILYVIDSSASQHIREARDNFREILEHPQISGKPVLVLANKVDVDDHMEEVDIIDKLHLEEAVNANNCPSHFVMVSALKGSGNKMDRSLQEGLEWLLGKVRSSFTSLEPRVEEDKRVAQEARDKEREERRARVKKRREERELEEKLERQKMGLGEEKEEDSDNEDIVDGDPFKALDINKLTAKEQRLKEEKKRKKDRLMELEQKELGGRNGIRRSLDDADVSYGSDNRFATPNSGKAGRNYGLGDASYLGLEEGSAMNSSSGLFGRNTRPSALPPLEPLVSRSQDSALTGLERKKGKKKKKLTDYNLEGQGEKSLRSSQEDTMARLGLSLHEAGRWNRPEADIHDLTPRVAKPIQLRAMKAGRIEEDEEEDEEEYPPLKSSDLRNGYSGKHSFQGVRQGQRHLKEDSYPGRGVGDGAMNKYLKSPRVPEREDSLYRQSLRNIAPPNLTRFSAEDEEDEGIEDDSENGSDGVRYRSGGQRNKENSMRGASVNKIKVAGRKRLDSDEMDEDEKEFTIHSSMKDTLRFPRSPTDEEPVRDFRKEMDKLRYRKDHDFDSQRRDKSSKPSNSGYRNGYDNEGYSRYNDIAYDSDELSQRRSAHRFQSGEDYNESHSSERPESRRKKKRNLLKSNRLAPLDDDADHSPSSQFTSPRLVQEHGSRNTSDADTPSKNRNSRVTQFHRNMSNDSDLGGRWGLAEDLPAIDSNYNVRRLPNYDDSDGGDVIF